LEHALGNTSVTVVRNTLGAAAVSTAFDGATGMRAISSVTTVEGTTYTGRIFIDCSYEGDPTSANHIHRHFAFLTIIAPYTCPDCISKY